MDDRQRFVRKLDRALDRYGDAVGWADVELVLQSRAQDARELAYQRGDRRVIDGEDVDGWDA